MSVADPLAQLAEPAPSGAPSMTLEFGMPDLHLLTAGIQTHLYEQLSREESVEPARLQRAQRLLERALAAEPGPFSVSALEALELAEALDSHLYWFIARPEHRANGLVVWRGLKDPEYAEEILACERLEAVLRRTAAELTGPPVPTDGDADGAA